MSKQKKLSPAELRRYIEDAERKGDQKSAGVLRVLSEVVHYGRRITTSDSSSLVIEAFWQRIYLVLTEIENNHRRLAASIAESLQGAPNHHGLSKMNLAAQPVVDIHDELRAVLTDADLALIDFRRHAASHVAVDAYRIGLANGSLIDGSTMTILGGRMLTVRQKDTLIEAARVAHGDDNTEAAKRLATSILPILERLGVAARPLHVPVKWTHNRIHVVEDVDGTWIEIAEAAGVDLQALLEANGDPGALAVPTPGTIIIVPGD